MGQESKLGYLKLFYRLTACGVFLIFLNSTRLGVEIVPYLAGTAFTLLSVGLFSPLLKRYQQFFSYYGITVLFTITCIAPFYTGGLNSPALLFQLFLPILAVFMANQKFSLIVVSGVFINYLITVVLSINGFEYNQAFPEDYFLRHRMIAMTFTLVMSFSFAYKFMSELNTAVKEKNEHETTKNLLFEIFNNADFFIGVKEINGPVLFHSKEFIDVTGIDPTDGKIYGIEDFHPKWAADLVQYKGIPEALEKGISTQETAIIAKDGSEVPVLQTLLIHKDSNGNPKYASTIMKDISHLKEHEQKLQDEIFEREAAQKQAIAASNAKSVFLANMSHEIRTPLNGIMGLVDVIEDEIQNADIKDKLKMIKSSGRTLAAVINDVLDFSKIEANKIELAPRDFDLHFMFKETQGLFSEFAKSRGNSLELNISDSVPSYIFADDIRIKQIINNLVSNAIKFTENGKITIDANFKDQDLVVKVTDTGIGIPKEKLDNVFMDFTQVDSTTTRTYGGTGLGLSISKSLAHILNGDIEIESEVGKGSIFSFNIKVQVADAIEDSINKDKSEVQIIPTHLNILVAEDNAINQKVVLGLLKKLGLNADIANNGEEAVNACKKKKYDLLLMDFHMPIMDGIEATRKILGSSDHHPYIIALTASTMKEDIDKCYAAGMSDFLSKPLSKENLRTAILNHQTKNLKAS